MKKSNRDRDSYTPPSPFSPPPVPPLLTFLFFLILPHLAPPHFSLIFIPPSTPQPTREATLKMQEENARLKSIEDERRKWESIRDPTDTRPQFFQRLSKSRGGFFLILLARKKLCLA